MHGIPSQTSYIPPCSSFFSHPHPVLLSNLLIRPPLLKVAARIGDTNVDAIQELVSDTIDWLDDHPDAEEDVYVNQSFIM